MHNAHDFSKKANVQVKWSPLQFKWVEVILELSESDILLWLRRPIKLSFTSFNFKKKIEIISN